MGNKMDFQEALRDLINLKGLDEEELRKQQEADVNEMVEKLEQMKNQPLQEKELKCPVCKSYRTKRVQKTQNNGVVGPGGRSWVVSEHYVCGKCGVMFQDVAKL